MRLTVLGAGPAYSDRAGSIGSSYLLTVDDAALLIDLGHGAFASLARRIEPSALAAVVVSHLHPDHFVDLVPLRHYLRYEFEPPRRVRVIGPEGIARRLDGLHDEPGFTAQALDVERLGEGVQRVGPFELEARLVTHNEESYGFRVSVPTGEGGTGVPHGLVYSGDCADASDLLPLARPGDVLLSEIAFGAGPVPAGAQHLDGPAVGDVARRARVSSLLLTHLQMGYDPEEALASVRRAYDGPVRFVWPGDEISI